uniref:Transmembrane protein n=1 Tax=Elaeophora elaphi TaxID=1147741 RepID=A0A0R3S115_9BILA
MGTSWSSNAELQNYYDQQAVKQVALQNVLLEHKEALELANKRKLVSNEHLIASLAVSLMLISQKIKQSHLFILPAVPLVVGVINNFDQQRDITLDTIKEKAQELRRENRHLFEPVGGPITLDELDRRISQAKCHKERESTVQR